MVNRAGRNNIENLYFNEHNGIKKNDKNYSQELSESDTNIIKKMIHKLSTKEISEIISHNKNISKKEIYKYCLKLKNEI